MISSGFLGITGFTGFGEGCGSFGFTGVEIVGSGSIGFIGFVGEDFAAGTITGFLGITGSAPPFHTSGLGSFGFTVIGSGSLEISGLVSGCPRF